MRTLQPFGNTRDRTVGSGPSGSYVPAGPADVALDPSFREWLIGAVADARVRAFALCEVEGRRPDDLELARALATIGSEGWAARILSNPQ